MGEEETLFPGRSIPGFFGGFLGPGAQRKAREKCRRWRVPTLENQAELMGFRREVWVFADEIGRDGERFGAALLHLPGERA